MEAETSPHKLKVERVEPGSTLAPEGSQMAAMEASEREDEFDQLDSDYGEDEELDDPSGFKIRGALDEPKLLKYTTGDLHKLVHQGEIDLSPPYQRDVVWPETKQSALIDSLFRNYYVPPILLVVTKQEEGEEVMVCMDGKQRLTSIQKFFDGQIPMVDHFTKKKWWFTASQSQSKSKQLIPDKFKQIFAKKEIHCVIYMNLEMDVERDIFQRVQMGVTLTAAEKLQAISAPWADWVHELNERYVRSDEQSANGLMDILQWDTKRGRNFQCMAQMVFGCDQASSGAAMHPEPTAAKLEKWLVRVDPPNEAFKSKIKRTMGAYWVLASDHKEPFTSIKQRLAPIEFVFIGILIYMMIGDDAPRPEEMPLIAKAALGLRKALRHKHKDVRMNNRCIATAWEYIDSIETNVELRAVATNGIKKRKRGRQDEEEYQPSPITSLGPGLKTRGRPPNS